MEAVENEQPKANKSTLYTKNKHRPKLFTELIYEEEKIMLTKGYNKFITLLLAVALIITITLTPQPTYAESNLQKSEALSLNDVYKIYENSCDEISLISSDENQLVYDVTIDTGDGEKIISHITASVDNNGNQTLDIRENGKRNIVTIDSERNIYLDGELVEIETVEENETSAPEIVPRVGHRVYWKKEAPYGKSSDYTKLVSTAKKKLTYTKPIKNATVSALIGIIATGLGLGAVGGTILTFVAEGLISYFEKNNPAGKAWSIKDATYEHKSKGFSVTSRMSVHKHVFTYYANTNFTGKIGSGSRYQVFSY